MLDRFAKSKLVELLSDVNCVGEEDFGNCPYRIYGRCSKIQRLEMCTIFCLADHLLAKSVIVPPCKVGQTVYMPWKWKGQEGIACLTVRKIIINTIRHYVRSDFETDDEQYKEAYRYGEFDFEDFGKDVFLTREEAEKALARQGGCH